jgi:hypothetical protein
MPITAIRTEIQNKDLDHAVNIEHIVIFVVAAGI